MVEYRQTTRKPERTTNKKRTDRKDAGHLSCSAPFLSLCLFLTRVFSFLFWFLFHLLPFQHARMNQLAQQTTLIYGPAFGIGPRKRLDTWGEEKEKLVYEPRKAVCFKTTATRVAKLSDTDTSLSLCSLVVRCIVRFANFSLLAKSNCPHTVADDAERRRACWK